MRRLKPDRSTRKYPDPRGAYPRPVRTDRTIPAFPRGWGTVRVEVYVRGGHDGLFLNVKSVRKWLIRFVPPGQATGPHLYDEPIDDRLSDHCALADGGKLEAQLLEIGPEGPLCEKVGRL
jgi:hypothetical protein